MKTLVLVILTLFTFSINQTASAQEEKHIVVATYNGVTDDYYFEFLDEDGNSIIFNEINGDVDVNLFEEEAIGKKFEITWEDYSFEETDEEGNATGEMIAAKRIIAMTEIEE